MDLLLCSLFVQASVRRGANLVVTPIRAPALAMSPALPIEASWIGHEAQLAYVRCTSILLKNPLLWRARALDLSGVSEADSCLFALCGEDRRREGDKLRQFSQILGGGG